MSRPQAAPRSAYRHFASITTRWSDNDVYGHINNVVYYSFFDTAVNRYLIDAGALDIANGATIGLVVHTQCHYFSPLSFPEPIEAGIAVAHIGRNSVRYQVGLFAKDQALSAAHGEFVHVYVDAAQRRPAALSAVLLQALEGLQWPVNPQTVALDAPSE